MARKIQFKRGTAASWTSTNPTLAVGELGLETDTGKIKIGDGVTAWSSRPYIDAAAVAHIADAADAHDASAISNVPAGGLVATDVQAALNELDTEKLAAATLTTDGDLLTRAAGAPARITRASLAADSAFSSRLLPVAEGTVGQVPTVTDDDPYTIGWGTGGGSGDGMVYFGVACSDETTALTTGAAKVTFRMPFAMTVSSVRANLATASSSGLVTVDINTDGVTMLSTKLSIDANERTSTTAATAAVISVDDLTDDSEMTIDLDAAGTNAKGLKVWLIGQRVIA
jgi:hypothetical protein